MNKKQKKERILEIKKLYLENIVVYARIEYGFNQFTDEIPFEISVLQRKELKSIQESSENFRKFLNWVDWKLGCKARDYFRNLAYECAALQKSLDSGERGFKDYYRSLLVLSDIQPTFDSINAMFVEFNEMLSDFMGNFSYFEESRLKARAYWQKLVDAEEEQESIIDKIDLFFVQLKYEKYGQDFCDAIEDLFDGEDGCNALSASEIDSVLSKGNNADKLMAVIEHIKVLDQNAKDRFEFLKDRRRHLNSFLRDIGEPIEIRQVKHYTINNSFIYETVGLGVGDLEKIINFRPKKTNANG